MIKKTVAIAVLILLMTSLASGSIGSGQAGVTANSDTAANARNTQHRYTSASGTTAGAFSGSHAVAPERGYTTMVIYMNESRVEAPTPFSGPAIVSGDGPMTHARLITAGPASGNMTVHSRVTMFRPGSMAPETYDLKWEGHHADMPGAAGLPELFSAHLLISPAEGGLGLNPDGHASGAIELNGSIAVDLANAPAADDAGATANPYNNAITGGETNWHSIDVASALKAINIDLKWQDPSDSLRLVIYTADGKVLGPYYDDSDGSTDARINLNIANPSGVAAGEWYLKVTDTALAGNDQYYLKTY